MDYHVFKSMLNKYYARHVGGQQRETFFDIAKTYPALNNLTKNFAVIKEEFETAFKSQPNMPLYHEIDPGESEISNTTANQWKVFMLYLLGHKPQANRELCPETCRILETIPNVIQAFFSILEPGKSIPLHEGPYLGYLRFHLGIQVPKVNPPRLYVNSQEYIWQEGEAVMFDDSWPHAVVNNCEELRAVLIVDILRPMPLAPSLINKAITGILARYTYGRRVMSKLKGHQIKDEPLIT
jgi:aspartate beta-hydroxylase/beta-hydroxylase